MKSFDEFLSTLKPEDQQAITQQALARLTGDGHTFGTDEMRLAVSIATASSVCMREMLRRYHAWVSEQIG